MNDQETTKERFDFAAAFAGTFVECAAEGCSNRVTGRNGAKCLECQIGMPELSTRERALLASVPRSFRWADAISPLWRRPDWQGERLQDLTATLRVVFVGPSGAGKTTLAVAALRALARAGIPGVFMVSDELAVARIQHPAGRGEAPTVLQAMTSPLLVLDDLGLDVAHATSAVAEVIHRRHSNNLRTWITTGLTPAELVARYGAHIVRRIFDGAARIELNVLPREVKQ